MKIQWIIEEADRCRILEFIRQNEHRFFVKTRMSRNVNGPLPEYSRDIFWMAHMACLLTTQQRSGPYSKVNIFINTKPFQLRYETCLENMENLEEYIADILRENHIRMGNRIGNFSKINLNFLESKGWHLIDVCAKKLIHQRMRVPERNDWIIERKVIEETHENFIGFGPKQSRNLWQTLGLIRYEIPIDSRIIKWLNEQQFPLLLTSNSLSDKNYYNFILDGVREMCTACEVLPCILDACVFSSYDKEEWSEESLIL